MNVVFDFSSFPSLTTQRLYLRQLQHDDAESIRELFNSPEVLRYLNQSPIGTREKAVGLIDWFNRSFDEHKAVQWAIVLRDEERFIGTCGIYDWDRDNRHIDMGYHILPAHWGKGYATEASHAIIRWSFANMNLHRIQADCTEGHIGSERVLLKCGFTVEGIWRENYWEHGRFVNVKQFGLLYHEYPMT